MRDIEGRPSKARFQTETDVTGLLPLLPGAKL